MNDDDFLAAFEGATLPPDAFHHRDHLRLAWICLDRDSLPRALERITAGLKRYTAAHGAGHQYHETLTWAWVLVVHDRRVRLETGHGWPAFEAAWPELFAGHPGVLGRYYTPGALASDLARRTFVMPDRCAAVI